ncbi:hypothetical protein BGK38_06555 [Corynebacterium diphtheriae]|nr:hypothetical protein BGK38_06555 [Corynebacterium diphtheriae]OLN19769.1 hypothetical protein BUE67_07090 [Corynebacterium diphtheriae]OMO43792.1 hypothetical protein BVL41_07730 [Corynebacterium diphtheriae]ONF68508.1 hypothetical protein BXA19_07350 [Corynebacterium diphtheriae]
MLLKLKNEVIATGGCMSAHHSRIETIDQIAKSLGAQNSRDVAKLFGITTDQLDQLRYGTVDTKTAIVLAARANTLRAAADKLDEAAA